MTQSEYLAAAHQVIRLVACAVRGKIPENGLPEGMDPEHVYQVAAFHHLAAAVGMALDSAGLQIDSFQKAVTAAQHRQIQMDQERAQVLSALDDAGIRHMPLRGFAIRDLYPRCGMQEMADDDILVDETRMADVRSLMENLGFAVESFGKATHDVYSRQPVSHFEMHRQLFSSLSSDRLAAYYAHVWDRLIPDEDCTCRYHFSDTDQYLYLTAHEYRHLSGNGTGLRSLLDIFVFLQHREPDWMQVALEAEHMGLTDFEWKNRELALRLFCGEPLEESRQALYEHFLFAGTFGTLISGTTRTIEEKGRFRSFLSSLTLPYKTMQEIFPLLRRVPVLYPLCWAWRLCRAPFSPGSHRALPEVRSVIGIGTVRKKQAAHADRSPKRH